MVRVRMKCDAPQFTPNDYVYIMQCRDIKPRYKILKELLDKYKTSSNVFIRFGEGKKLIEFSGTNLYPTHMMMMMMTQIEILSVLL